MPTAEEFKLRFPDFTQKNAVIEMAISDANDLIGGVGKNAILFGAAHILSLAGGAAVDGGDGEVESAQVGSRIESFVPQAERGTEAYWTTTRYGRHALKLGKSSFLCGMPVVG